MKILAVEDEIELLKTIQETLEKESYLVETANHYRDALEKLMEYDYDCILLDIMLPGGSGIELLKELKSLNKLSNVIIISAKDSLDDKLTGLELGADDYLTKPFHTAELNARIKAVLRRNVFDGKNKITFSNAELDINNHQVFVDNQELVLNRKEFDILYYFFVNKNRLVTRTALAEHVWGDNIDQADNFDFIYSQIKNLRKKLQDSSAGFELQSVYGVGYKLIEL